MIGSGISGLSAAWLLDRAADITIYEAEHRIGGHAHTVSVAHEGGERSVDIGFIVYNEATYPNLTALFDYIGVATKTTNMSLAISIDDGRLEYAGGYLHQLFAQKRNVLRPRFWSMLRDLVRFYDQAPRDLMRLASADMTLGAYLRENNYGAAFRDDHLLPMAAAIWSAPVGKVLDFPAHAFIRFQENHGLLKVKGRPLWRTVEGGSREYVAKLLDGFGGRIRTAAGVQRIERQAGGVVVHAADGSDEIYDQVVVATHADQALAMLAHPTRREQEILGAFRYTVNEAILHSDQQLMPKRARAWASWNYLGNSSEADQLTVTYWMNLLQGLPADPPLFVTLNAKQQPAAGAVHWRQRFEHPQMDQRAGKAQQALWSLQGEDRIWYCGAYFGAGFHEDGLQAGLAVAEAIADVRRPWQVPNESGRIVLGADRRTATGSVVA